MNNRLVLLVGGAGYIGCPLTDLLLAKGYRVRCLDSLVYGHHAAVAGFLGHANYEFVRGDLRDQVTCWRALEGVTDVVILAGLVGDPVCKANPALHQAINVVGLGRFVDSLEGRGLNKVVFASTCSNYGQCEGLAHEGTPVKPLGPYAVAKVNRELQLLTGDHDYCPVVLRFATAFGLSSRMRFDLTVSEFTRALWAGEVLDVYEGDTWRPYVHVRDIAAVVDRVLSTDADPVAGQVFNVGGENLTKQMLVDTIKPHVKEPVIRYRLVASEDRRDYRVIFDKIRDRLGFVATRTVADGVAELLQALGQGFYRDIHDSWGTLDKWPSFYRNDNGIEMLTDEKRAAVPVTGAALTSMNGLHVSSPLG